MPSRRNISTLRRSSSNASARSKPDGPQLPDGRLLEVAGQLVVAPRPHDEQVPADVVAAEPRLGQVVDPVRPGGQQHDLQVGIEEVEQRLAPLRSPGPRRTRRRTRASRGAAPRGSAGGSVASESTPSMSTTTAAAGRERLGAPASSARGVYRTRLGRHSSAGVLGEVARLDAVDDRRVGERRRVAERLVLGDVAQQAPHDLARARLRAAPR